MKVSAYLQEQCCIMELASKNKNDAIKEIATQLAKAGKVADLNRFVSDILEREALGSTGIGHGIAIPHARTGTLGAFAIGFGRSTEGIDFKSIDGQNVHLVFLMGADPKELNLYLRLLAELSKLLMNHSFRSSLMNAKTPQEIIKAIKGFET